jgi:hypothetical protein
MERCVMGSVSAAGNIFYRELYPYFALRLNILFVHYSSDKKEEVLKII